MRLTPGGVRELHWHVEAEWAIMLNGNACITAVDQQGKKFCPRCEQGRLVALSARDSAFDSGSGSDGCSFLLVFDDGDFDEFHTFLLTDWLGHTPKDVLAKNFDVPQSTFDKVPKRELFIFQAGLPGDLKAEQDQGARGTGTVPKPFDFKASTMKPTKVCWASPGGLIFPSNGPGNRALNMRE